MGVRVIQIAGVVATLLISCTQATVTGQYSVNVHFVAPLVNAPCRVAEFWNPPNVICGLCFCMTGTLSRCIPQPGCDPQSQNGTTTMAPTDNSSNNDPEKPPEGPSQPDNGGKPNEGTEQQQQPPNAPPPEGDKPAPPPSEAEKPNNPQPPQEPPQSDPEAGGSAGTPGKAKLRGSKPGKSRRRRQLRQ